MFAGIFLLQKEEHCLQFQLIFQKMKRFEHFHFFQQHIFQLISCQMVLELVSFFSLSETGRVFVIWGIHQTKSFTSTLALSPHSPFKTSRSNCFYNHFLIISICTFFESSVNLKTYSQWMLTWKIPLFVLFSTSFSPKLRSR